jgi:hypothetical protein
LTFAVPPLFGLSAISFQVQPTLAIPWTLMTLSLRQSLLSFDLSVCGSQVHSSPAQVSAHTFPDSLNPALGCTSPVLSLFPYSIIYNINAAHQFVNTAMVVQDTRAWAPTGTLSGITVHKLVPSSAITSTDAKSELSKPHHTDLATQAASRASNGAGASRRRAPHHGLASTMPEGASSCTPR